ncbi:hypothetical protein L6R52_14675 [Myxococcota bacterium]|nr:hypothetical protein [Myxococcota bacterium]
MSERSGITWAGAIYLVVGVGAVVGSFFQGFLDLLHGLAMPHAVPAAAGVGLWATVVGGLTAGFGATIIAVARAMDRGPAAVARALATGVGVWCLVDSAGSLGHGSWQNVVGNVAFAAIGLVPLVLFARSASTRAPIVTQAM